MIDADRILDEFLDENHEEVVRLDNTNRQLLGENYYSLYGYGTVNLIALSYHSINNFRQAKIIAEYAITRLKQETLPERRHVEQAVAVLILSCFELSMFSKSYHYAMIYLKYGFEEEHVLRAIDVVKNKVIGKYPIIIAIVSTVVKYLLRVLGFYFAYSTGFRVMMIIVILLSILGIIWPKRFVSMYANTIEKFIVRYFVKL